MNSLANQKTTLRKAVLAQRDALDPNARTRLSRIITYKLLALPEYKNAKTVLAYMSIGSEFDTTELVRDVLASGKMLVLPKVNRAAKHLDLYRVHDPETDLLAGVWGIREPDAHLCEPVSLQQIDFVLMPGVVFDVDGNRIGYGGGYYDKLLANANKKTPLIGAAYSLQLVDNIPHDSHDIKLHSVITNS
jgi:5,10-methenyltetrahydrofolate synthetase